MNYIKAVDGNTCKVEMEGELVFSDWDKLRKVTSMFEGEIKKFVFDISKVNFIDTAALEMFLFAAEEAEKNAVALEIRNPQGQVKKLLDVSKFNALFTIS